MPVFSFTEHPCDGSYVGPLAMQADEGAQHASAASLKACEASLQTGSRSFHLASRLLPQRVRQPAAILYAFCREADDLVDEGGGHAALRLLRTRVRDLVDQPADRDRLLADIITRHRIPVPILDALLDGFAQDVEHQQPDGIEDLILYAVRVAGTVGLAMALVMGVRDRAALQGALALGVAMQLTNICRDVGEDAGIGRLYLPRNWLADAGIDGDAWRAQPAANPAIAAVVRRLLLVADRYYALADRGIASLPADCRPGIVAARRLYAGIGHALRDRGCDSVTRRTVLGPVQKLACLILPARLKAVDLLDPWCEAMLECQAAALLQVCPVGRSVRDRAGLAAGVYRWWARKGLFVLELFERLEHRAIAARAAGQSRSAPVPGLDWQG